MKGGSASKFLDQTTYEECAVIYKGVKYFFYGLLFDKSKNEYSYTIDALDCDGNYLKTAFDKTDSTMKGCMDLALDAPIFDGKTFWQAEADMEWVEW